MADQKKETITPLEVARVTTMMGTSRDERLMDQERYAEVFLIHWARTEIAVDDCVAWLFGIDPAEEESMIFGEISFGRKLSYLKSRKVLRKQEFDSVQSLQRRRNRVVHEDGLDPRTSVQRQLAEDAMRISNIVRRAANKVLKKQPKLQRKVFHIYGI